MSVREHIVHHLGWLNFRRLRRRRSEGFTSPCRSTSKLECCIPTAALQRAGITPRLSLGTLSLSSRGFACGRAFRKLPSSLLQAVPGRVSTTASQQSGVQSQVCTNPLMVLGRGFAPRRAFRKLPSSLLKLSSSRMPTLQQSETSNNEHVSKQATMCM